MHPIQLVVTFISLVALLSAVTTADSIPCSGSLTSSLVLPKDLFCPISGPSLDAVGIVLDCQGHAITGAGSGAGVVLNAQGSGIHSCVIEGFSVGVASSRTQGVMVRDSVVQENRIGMQFDHVVGAWVVGNKIRKNNVGVQSEQSMVSLVENEIENNEVNLLDLNPVEGSSNILTGASVLAGESMPPAFGFAPPSSVPEPPIQTFENRVSEALLSKVGVNTSVYVGVSQKIEIRKSFLIRDETLTFLVVLKALEPVDAVVMYEVIPKRVASSAFDISSNWQFSMIEPDPIIRFEIGDLDPSREVQIQYKVPFPAGEIGGVEPSTSILTQEVTLPQGMSFPIQILAGVFLLCFLGWFIVENAGNVKKRVLHASCCAMVFAFFFLLYLEIGVVVSRLFHESLLIGLFVMGAVYYSIQGFLEWAQRLPAGKG